MTRKSLAELVDPGWASALAPVEGQVHAMGDFLRAERAAGRHFLPAAQNILRAFTYPLAEVKVLIVGQDPYPTPGNAIGLSFAVAPGVALPKSLVNIFNELESDVGVARPTSGDLTPWAERGVMLLNRVLTVEPGRAGSHRGKGWEAVTECAIDALVARGGPLVAVLWGSAAQSLRPRLGSVPAIESVHPSPLSAYRGFFGSRPFSRVNEALVAAGGDPVDWALP
ncbi:uracil-DNA glycosylase [Rarobacter faecitabidus]|uniref:Uracil-DNA glycosylase n=1 Tax=Rarobacter faecitabidus TaxID=13243 RepID=A0A542ZP99_RARFA|nr:uracil-DNA glycosylase [Rarobacter faecitabidus]TQL62185.1 uracil-DNA glycosylase [Rarobacter faecitabidus]